MTHFGFAGCSAGGVACIFSGVFEGVGVATAATFDARKFSGGGEVVAMVAAGQMPGGPVVGNHL
jgi:ABC-type taurine transport system substrate-binding protein